MRTNIFDRVDCKKTESSLKKRQVKTETSQLKKYENVLKMLTKRVVELEKLNEIEVEEEEEELEEEEDEEKEEDEEEEDAFNDDNDEDD